MSDEAKLKLIFANDNASEEITTTMNTTVRDVKSTIMESHWPASFIDIETVERIRLFAGGRELGGKGVDDQKSLRDAMLPPSSSYPTPVHVQPVLKSAEATAEREAAAKPSQCFCVVL
mmetsp:Transcript_97662/g.280594  ORF Transcript_97662/g.280594 Transcript_97662/m.280594 type:complete len:118 (-) Transcript_97662:222-575(-)|eukprot:CAMPEP_0177291524 /NCGR_PEP_ID=MMETSP0367-20130122/76307_1 /TAXON_ID=447022 ORGANISM="Scrippsiella hangoei-like, Strain SHHI-4" /NCGR_SAMPLE_ID=MMETSP0367 /ASSEMBLY_ACC=CAM_ASM_000362 /LENGTH=117 /DNA_ID=CAMNT_0018749053 /DNA_START=174 /DNA_END=527 /DNA_ORIENTATION=+